MICPPLLWSQAPHRIFQRLSDRCHAVFVDHLSQSSSLCHAPQAHGPSSMSHGSVQAL